MMVDVIYLAVIKAFARVAHTRLAIKLKAVGTGNLISWCISFLAFCKQRVIMGSNVGDSRKFLFLIKLHQFGIIF